jgi:PKD repeat protein
MTKTLYKPNYLYLTTILCAVAFLAVSCQVESSDGQPPTLKASFTYSPTSPAAGQTVHFTDTSTGSPTSWEWGFGDGTTSTSQNPTNTYAAAGPYTVALTIRVGSDSNSTSRTVSVWQSGIIPAASPSFTDVRAAIAQANPGDTVIVPAGTATWNDHLVITEGVNLIGAGKDGTIITSNYACPNQHIQPANGYSPSQVLEQYLITYQPSNPSANEPFRLSGFAFDLASKCEGIMVVNYVDSPHITNIRIDNNSIKNPAIGTNPSYPWEYGVGIVMCLWGQIYGVVDNNEISGAAYFNVIGMNEANWTNQTFQHGSADSLYIEDNDITLASSDTSQCCMVSGAGGRWCFRYNHIHATACPQGLWPVLDAHGNTGVGGNLSLMGFEAYGNTVDIGTYNGRFTDQRGGRALVYNNNIITRGSVSIVVREEYLDSTSPPATASDGETQHACNSYYWSNTKNTSTRIDPVIGGTVDYGGSIGLVPQANRDFWFQGSSFNGTTGMGVGPLASRPVTCTTGVAYWATDEGKLYVATATNVWTLYYTPYTYPHPLRK